jgi:D-alanyl-D-alanine carboxypeptidase (penicillin-binding protein 5/6)
VPGFVKLMNEKSLELGAYKTSFITPHGLDAENHFTTAEDLAKITAYAMKNETFAKIVSTKQISAGESGDFNRSYSNINKFLYRIDNSDGVKTGFTGNAGKCLVASVKNSFGRFICVVLNSSDRWRDAEKLINYANTNYKFIRLMENKEAIKRFKVYGGNIKYINGQVKNDIYFPVLPEEISKIKIEVFAPSVLFSPIKTGEIIGNITISINEKIVAKYPIFSDREVKRKNFIDFVKSSIFN